GEVLAELLLHGVVGGGDARLEELFRGERQLVAVLRFPLPPRAVHVESFALAEPAGELTINVDREPAVDSARRQAVGRAQDVDYGLSEAGLIGAERLVAGLRRR